MANAVSAVTDIIPVAIAAGVAGNVIGSLSGAQRKKAKRRNDDAGGFFVEKGKDKFGGFF